MPEGAKILSVGNQRGNLCLWAMVDPTNPGVFRIFEMIGTGYPLSDVGLQFIGTVVIEPFVWHVFERTGRIEYA